ncbi:beta strand repeat-containing protein [Usitatibacter palustris]|uniref:Uncharacterized protein n=1 Tax=Usitatibacter palustris TaxID=2732487 RepID=A0A6M4H7G0_9PROT|nr:IPTL-CTERM sorting domain-containing protein [Usitatibacter palustris]QJR15105.1 hypothetical protein DSM104440_01922 [Usitatibacter palustris]
MPRLRTAIPAIASFLAFLSFAAYGGVVGSIVDSVGSVGSFTSLQLNGGNPVISYHDLTNGTLKLATCTANCQSATPTWQIVTVDVGGVGLHSSLRLNAGNPVISYRDVSNGDLKLATCTANCQSAVPTWQIVTVDAAGDTGYFTSMSLNGGNPVITYETAGAGLRMATCTANCATATPTWVIVNVVANGQVSSLQLNGGNPVISYQNFGSQDLELATCIANCATPVPTWQFVSVDAPGNVGTYSSLVLNGGNPVISYYNTGSQDLKLATCTANCQSATPTWQVVTVDSAGSQGVFTSLQLDAGRPVIAHYDIANNDLRLATCTANCQSATPTWRLSTIESAGSKGSTPSLQLSGLDVLISHFDNGDLDLRFASVTPPTVTSIVRAATNPTNAASVTYTVTFSESVTGVDASDFTLVTTGAVTGASVTGLSGTGTTYTVTVGTGTGDGTLRLDLVDNDSIGGFLPLAGLGVGNGNATGEVYTIEKTPPTVTINQAGAQADPTMASPILFTVTFNETVTGFAAAGVSFAGSTVGGTLVANVSGSGTTYTVSVTGMSGNGSVVASIAAGAAADAVGNTSLASTSTDNAVTFGAAPSVTINQAGGQADPTNASPVLFTVTFSEPVTGFTGTDVSFTGSTVGGTLAANVTGSGTTYTVSVTGMTGNGAVVTSIPAGAATNGAFTSLASTSTDNTVAFDGTAPTVTINQAGAQADPAGASPILFTVVFSEPVTGFTNTDVSFAGSTAAGTLAAAITGSGANYTVSVSGMTGNGTVIASIPAAGVIDVGGNANLASTSTDNSVLYNGAGVVTTFTGPSATGSGNITAQFTGGGPICSFATPQYIGPPPGAAPIPPTAPPGAIAFPHGLFDFRTVNCTPGATLAFTITYASALGTTAQYWKYGPEPGNATPHWYVLPATIVGNVVTFSITDGGQGDDDLAANGTIVDQGGPGVPGAPGTATAVPTLSEWMLMLLALVMLGSAGVFRRPSRRV